MRRTHQSVRQSDGNLKKNEPIGDDRLFAAYRTQFHNPEMQKLGKHLYYEMHYGTLKDTSKMYSNAAQTFAATIITRVTW